MLEEQGLHLNRTHCRQDLIPEEREADLLYDFFATAWPRSLLATEA
jgi:hypothetical protein